MSYLNKYNITLEKEDGTTVDVSLRLTTRKMIELKNKYHETALQTLMGAIDDPERLVDVLEASLDWKGNQNPIKKGIDLADLLAENDMLGMMGTQKLMTAIGRASNIFSEDEREAIDSKAEARMGKLFLTDEDEKNA